MRIPSLIMKTNDEELSTPFQHAPSSLPKGKRRADPPRFAAARPDIQIVGQFESAAERVSVVSLGGNAQSLWGGKPYNFEP